MRLVANDNGRSFTLHPAFLYAKHGYTWARPSKRDRPSDFVLAKSEAQGFRVLVTAICIMPGGEALAIHKHQQANPARSRPRPQLVSSYERKDEDAK